MQHHLPKRDLIRRLAPAAPIAIAEHGQPDVLRLLAVEWPTGLSDVDGVPERRLDEDVARFRRAARDFPAHDASQRFHALLVGNDTDALVELVGFAIERGEFLASPRTADDQIAINFGGIEYV